MKTTFTRFVLAAALAVVGLCAAPVSAAPLVVTADPTAVFGAPNESVQIKLTFSNPSDYVIENLSLNTITPDPSSALLGELSEGSFFFDFDGSPIGPGGGFVTHITFTFFGNAPIGPLFTESHSISFGYDAIPVQGGDALLAQEESVTVRAQAVPEPVTMSLFGIALAGAAIARRRRA